MEEEEEDDDDAPPSTRTVPRKSTASVALRRRVAPRGGVWSRGAKEEALEEAATATESRWKRKQRRLRSITTKQSLLLLAGRSGALPHFLTHTARRNDPPPV